MSQSMTHETKEQNRIHMLYKGNLHSDVEKERNLSMYQLNKAKSEVEKHTVGVHEMKTQNAELKKKLKRYLRLIEEQKDNVVKAEQQAGWQEDLNEASVTRKLNHTHIDDISDGLELNSAVLNRSIEGSGEPYVSRADINLQHSVMAIKKQDFGQDSIDFQNRDDISDKSFAPINNPNLNLSVSLA